MAKKKVKKSAVNPTTKILKKHFPTFYEKPVIVFGILLVLIAVFWIIR